MEDRGMGGRSQSRDHEVTVAQKGDKKFSDVLGVEEAMRVRVRVRVRVGLGVGLGVRGIETCTESSWPAVVD